MTLKKKVKKSRTKNQYLFHITGGSLVLALVLSGLMMFSATRPAQTACTKSAPTTAAGYEQLLRGPINGKWYHGDSGQSVKLPDGKLLWTFGDTLIGTTSAARGYTMVNNTGLVTEKGCINVLIGPMSGGKETSWIKPSALTDVPGVNDYYWAGTPFMDGSTLRIFLGHMYNDANGFHPIGSDLATFSLASGQPKLVNIVKTPGSASYDTMPFWGAAVITSGSYTYILGSMNKHEYLVFGNYYYLARVPNGQITLPTSWKYWTGTNWSTDPKAVQPIIKGEVGLATNVTVYKKSNGEFVIITKKYDVFGKDLVALKAANLTGPWTEVTPALLSPIPVPNYSSQDVTYLGLGHPEITLPSRKLLVHWSLNSNDASFFGDGRYGIYFAEVAQP